MTEDRKLGAAMLACLIASAGFAIGSLLGANALAEQNDRDLRASFCTIARNATATEERKLAEYDREPPQTDAGRAQKDAVEDSLRLWRDTLARARCPRE